MKTKLGISALIVFLGTSAGYGCPDISGKYAGEWAGGKIVWTLNQEGCGKLTWRTVYTPPSGEPQTILDVIPADSVVRKRAPENGMDMYRFCQTTDKEFICTLLAITPAQDHPKLYSLKVALTLDFARNLVVDRTRYDDMGNATYADHNVFPRCELSEIMTPAAPFLEPLRDIGPTR